jgi:uncharacterized protein DUF3987/bifunctional DNA primase/polymerase-like protein
MCDGFCARIFSAYPKSLTPLAIPHHRLTFPDPLSRDFRAMAFSNLDVALAYARANLRVFPCGHGKLPLTAGNWLANATTDEKQIRTWWSASPSALIGLPMKPHDLLVFDADRHHDSEDGIAHFRALCAEHEPLPPHPIVLTANGGEHHIFRQPTNKIGNRKLGNGLETRGYKDHNDGGFIIAAGSRLPDGRSWRRAKDTPSLLNATLPEPPAWLAEYASEQKTEWKPNGGGDRHQASNREARYAEAALRNCAAELAAQRKPGRNNLLNVCALKMGAIAARGWISRPAVADAFYAACRLNRLAQEDGDDSVQKTLASGFEAGWARPHPDLEERQHDARKQSAKASEPKASAHDWDDPDWSILDDRRGEPPEFPLQVLSPKVQSLINRTAKGAGVTPAHVAVPMLGIVSSLIGIARRIETTSSWRQPMTCWTTVVGFSGTGKTPGLNVTKRCVKQVERDNKNSDDAKRRAYETKKESATAAREKWKKAVKDAIENNVPAPPMPVEASDPGKFIPPKLYVSDGTIERLGELLQARPQGILFLRDELSGLFTNMSRYSSGQDNEFWLEAWNGDSFNVERMGRVTHVDHLLIGIAGGMQPDKLVKSFEGDHDGMYSRVLFAWPTEPDCPVLSDEAVEIDPDIQNIIARINKLAELTAEGTLVIRDVPLSQEARKQFAQFAQFAHREKDAFEGREREWFAKMTAHVLRLSGALTYLPWAMEGGPEPTTIDQGSMSSAIVLARDYFWPHARACLRQIGLTERHTNARRVLRWLKANHKTEVSREDVRRDALSQRLDADGTTELLATLCRSGWLREKASPQQATGRPPRRWSVNLKLFSPPTAETAETAETPTGAG